MPGRYGNDTSNRDPDMALTMTRSPPYLREPPCNELGLRTDDENEAVLKATKATTN